MKTPLLGLAAITLLGAIVAPRPQEKSKPEAWTVLIGGDTAGYLTPCGCVTPMSGGIKRRFTLTRSLTNGDHTLVLEAPGITSSTGRQAELKSETLAETWNAGHVDAASLSAQDLILGPAMIASVQRLSGGKLVSTSSVDTDGTPLPTSAEKGPFVVAALNNQNKADDEFSLATVLDKAARLDQTPVLLLDAPLERAEDLAKKFPALRLIVYRVSGNPPVKPQTVGKTLLVSPGEKGKHVLRILWNGESFEAYQAFDLGPDIKDDPETQRLFNRYLDRVRAEKLLEQVPRTSDTEYAGSKACQTCHAEAYNIWLKSEHSHALTTLEDQNEDADPECVSCHVVGLDSIHGFRSRKETPSLADVGCESCHGGAKLHAMKPKEFKLPKVGEASCAKCHTLDHSPNFDFLTYWPKVKH